MSVVIITMVFVLLKNSANNYTAHDACTAGVLRN